MKNENLKALHFEELFFEIRGGGLRGGERDDGCNR